MSFGLRETSLEWSAPLVFNLSTMAHYGPIFLWLPRVEHMAQNFLVFLLLSLFCAFGVFSRVPDAMELSV